jgi:hypothetical protein
MAVIMFLSWTFTKVKKWSALWTGGLRMSLNSLTLSLIMPDDPAAPIHKRKN